MIVSETIPERERKRDRTSCGKSLHRAINHNCEQSAPRLVHFTHKHIRSTRRVDFRLSHHRLIYVPVRTALLLFPLHQFGPGSKKNKKNIKKENSSCQPPAKRIQFRYRLILSTVSVPNCTFHRIEADLRAFRNSWLCRWKDEYSWKTYDRYKPFSIPQEKSAFHS